MNDVVMQIELFKPKRAERTFFSAEEFQQLVNAEFVCEDDLWWPIIWRRSNACAMQKMRAS